MFNREGFNSSYFNISAERFTYARGSFEALGDLSVNARYEVVVKSQLNGEGILLLTVSQGAQAIMDGQGAVSAKALKELYVKIELTGAGEMKAFANAYMLESLTLTGPFYGNDVIEIDSDKFTVKINGVNALTKLSEGDFFNLKNGINTIMYSDSSETRNIKIEVKKRDRWL